MEKSNVLTPQNILKAILSEESIKRIRRGLKKTTEVTVSPEEIVGAIRHLLNEAALIEMGKIRISLPGEKQHKTDHKPKVAQNAKPLEELLAGIDMGKEIRKDQ
jgi:hypothetical protein